MIYLEAREWMWNYCYYLGEFKGHDLGVCVDRDGEVSHAIVYDDEPGSYISGEIELFNKGELQEENIRRWNVNKKRKLMTTEEATERYECPGCNQGFCECTESNTGSIRCPSCNGRCWQDHSLSDPL